MVKLVTSVLAVSLLALPAFAAPAELYERSVAASDLYDRDLANVADILVTREDLYEIFGREFVNDIDERSPLGLGALFHIAKGLAGKAGHHSHHHMPSVDFNNNNNNNNNNRREFDEEELEAREPRGFGSVFRIAKGFAGKFGHKSHHHMPSVDFNNNNNNNNRREFDEEELEALEPFGFGSAFRVVKGIAGKVGHHSHHHMPSMDFNNNNNNNNRREFDEEEFDLRDFDEDLEAREPINVEKALRRAHKVYRAAQYIPTDNNNDRRDLVEEVFEREFDDDEFLAREYYDDLD